MVLFHKEIDLNFTLAGLKSLLIFVILNLLKFRITDFDKKCMLQYFLHYNNFLEICLFVDILFEVFNVFHCICFIIKAYGFSKCFNFNYNNDLP